MIRLKIILLKTVKIGWCKTLLSKEVFMDGATSIQFLSGHAMAPLGRPLPTYRERVVHLSLDLPKRVAEISFIVGGIMANVATYFITNYLTLTLFPPEILPIFS